MQFLEDKCLDSDLNVINITKVCSQWSIYKHPSTGSDTDLAPPRGQAIIWTNDGYFTEQVATQGARALKVRVWIFRQIGYSA